MYNNDFTQEAIFEKMSKINRQLEKLNENGEIDRQKEKELLYAQFLQGLKLNTFYTKKRYF